MACHRTGGAKVTAMDRFPNIYLSDTQLSYIITALRHVQETIYNAKDDADIDRLVAMFDEQSTAAENETGTGIILYRLAPR